MVPRPKAKSGTRRSTFREICAHDYENAFLAPWEALFSDPAPIIARSYQAITPSAQIGISRFQIRRLSEFHTKPSGFGEDFGFFGPKRIPRARKALQTRLWLENRDWTGVDRRFISFLSQRTGLDWFGSKTTKRTSPFYSRPLSSRLRGPLWSRGVLAESHVVPSGALW